MHLLVTGKGSSGSWRIRGEQLGGAIGASCIPEALDVAAFDAAIIVKRASPALLDRLHRARVPIIWDVVDAWPQPYGNDWSRAAAMSWLGAEVQRVKPAAVVAATRVMAHDLGRFCLPVICVPHHARPGLAVNETRPTVRTVGYEGGGHYLGHWEQSLRSICAARGWTFVINPPELAELDVVVALREARGYPACFWKSNVKLANAQGSGTPIVANPDAGYVETASGAERWVHTHSELGDALDELAHPAVRSDAAARLRGAAPQIAAVAAAYRSWLSALNF